jgi:cyanophycinase-like exopeptidase
MTERTRTDEAAAGPAIYLLADSEPLFRKIGGKLLLEPARELLKSERPKAAYIGASNGDSEVFYSIFEAAMDCIEVRTRKMIRASFAEPDRDFLREANIIVLAGGDAERGWKVILETGMKDEILERQRNGAVLVGVSAGAVQLGRYAIVEHNESSRELIDTFCLFPMLVDVHDEQGEWARLQHTVALLGQGTVGIGIPKGGAAVFHADGSLEAVGRPLCEVCLSQSGTTTNLIMPNQPAGSSGSADKPT